MKTIILLFLTFIFAFIQLNWNYYFHSFLSPQLLFILTIFFSLNLKGVSAFLLVFIGGLLMDVFCKGVFGLNLIVYISCYYYIRRIKSRIYKDYLYTQALVVLIGTFLNLLVLAIFNRSFSLKLIIFNSFITAIFSFPTLFILKKIFLFLKIKNSYR